MSKQVKPKPSAEAPTSELRTTAKSPLIFISHDSRDAELAEAFGKLLSSVSAGLLKTFRSSDRRGSQGIEYGVEWYPEIMSKLEVASDVVCLLTPRSFERPWILYEAGVAKGKLSTPVYGVALGIPVNRVNTTGPFAQFQNCDDKEESLAKLVIQLLGRIPGSEPDRDAILTQAKAFKEAATKALSKTGDPGDSESTPEISVAKLFEEIKLMFQDLPGRLEDRVMRGPSRHRRSARMHSMMMHEMMHRLIDRPDDPIAILISASMVRDDIPWLYELGREAYDSVRDGDPETAVRALDRFREALHMVLRGPVMEELGLHPGALIELEHFLEKYSPRVRGGRVVRKKLEKEGSETEAK